MTKNRVWIRISLVFTCLACIIYQAGCVSSLDVKLASSQMTLAIDEYGQNIKKFQTLWITEIEKTQTDLGQALIARAVKLRISELSDSSNEFTTNAWQKKFAKSGMIALSEEIEAAQESARMYVQRLFEYQLDDKPVSTVLAEIDAENAGALRFLADSIESRKPTEASRIRKYADSISARNKMTNDSMISSYAAQILEWRKLKEEIPNNLKNLEQVIDALRITHATVDGWIQTDVKASGEQIGDLVKKHSTVLGLQAGGGGQ